MSAALASMPGAAFAEISARVVLPRNSRRVILSLLIDLTALRRELILTFAHELLFLGYSPEKILPLACQKLARCTIEAPQQWAVIHTLVSPGFRQLDCDWRFDLFLWVHDEKDDFSPICNDRFPSAIYLCIYSFGGGAGEKSQVGV